MPIKKAPKRAAPKTSAAQKKAAPANTKAKRAAKTDAPEERSISSIIAGINKSLGNSVIRRADEMSSLYLLRRPCGITSLDIALGGGFPASSTTVFVGPDGSGKDYLLWRTAAESQKIYGEDFVMCAFLTEFKADKPFMRNLCGLKIAFSEEELEEYDDALEKSGQPRLTEEQRADMRTQIGEILIIDGTTAETGFDAIIKMVESNTCQMVVINSIGSLQTEAKEDQESFNDFARQSSEATLISKFMPKLAMTLNNDRNGRNQTSLFIVNQMRAKRDAAPVRGRPSTDKDKYEAGAKVWALKHGKAIELAIHKGPVHRDVTDDSIAGRKTRWELTKGKLGTHDGKKGEFDFFYDGGADVIGDLVAVCQGLGIFEGGTWVVYDHDEWGFKLQGKEAVRRRLQENPELVDHLRAEAFRKAGLVYTFR